MSMNESGQNWMTYCSQHKDELQCYYKDYIVPTWVHLVLCFIALALNTLCILGICTGCGKLNMRHHLVISLCASDSILVATEILTQFFTPSPYARLYYCIRSVYWSLDVLSHMSLVLNMAAMAMHHYIAVVKPLYYAEFKSSRKPKIMLSVVWVISIIVGCSNFLGASTDASRHVLDTCHIAILNVAKKYRYYVHAITTSLCLVISVFSYVNILLVMRRSHHRFAHRAQSTSRHRKAVVTTMLFMLTFILLYLPYDVIDAAINLEIKYYTDLDVYLVWEVVYLNLKVYQKLNCIFDPFIYALRQPDVLNGVKRCLCCCRNPPPRDARFVSRPTVPITKTVRSHVTTEL